MTLVKDTAIAIAAILGLVAAFVVAIVIGAILDGLVLSILWGWFIVPVFNFPSLSLVPAIGLALVVSHLTSQRADCKPKENDNGNTITKVVTIVLLRPLLVLLFGWILHLFM